MTSRNERDVGNIYKYNLNAYKHIHWVINRNMGKLSIDHFSYIFSSPNLTEFAESIFEARPFIHLLLMKTALVEEFLLYEVFFSREMKHPRGFQEKKMLVFRLKNIIFILRNTVYLFFFLSFLYLSFIQKENINNFILNHVLCFLINF